MRNIRGVTLRWQPYGAHTGAEWYSSTHIDVVGRNFDIWWMTRRLCGAALLDRGARAYPPETRRAQGKRAEKGVVCSAKNHNAMVAMISAWAYRAHSQCVSRPGVPFQESFSSLATVGDCPIRRG